MEVVDETEALQRFFEGEGPRAGGLANLSRWESPSDLPRDWDPRL